MYAGRMMIKKTHKCDLFNYSMAQPKSLNLFLQKNNRTSAIHVKAARCIQVYPKTCEIWDKWKWSIANLIYIVYVFLLCFLNIEAKVIERICVCSTSMKRKHTSLTAWTFLQGLSLSWTSSFHLILLHNTFLVPFLLFFLTFQEKRSNQFKTLK